ncbi:MAG TPA: acyl-CoA thioesterase domain-containing protein [Acidimicrobiia bacterium]|jgi:acyl-coenzyme A thioesterase PaaI-like protein
MTTIPPGPPESAVGGSITDLDITTEQTSLTSARSMSPLTDAVRDASGAAGLGYLVGLVDVNTAMVGLCASSPDWTATSDLMLHEAAPLVHGPTILESHLTRAGSRLIVVSVDIYDGDGLTDMDELTDPIELTRVATGLVTFARVPASTSTASTTWDPTATIGERRHMELSGALPTAPLLERIGLTVMDAPGGVVEVANSPYVRNSRGRINGGVLGMVFQGAAEAAAPGYVGSDLHIHYLASARVGPIRTDTHIVREVDDHVVSRVVAMDAGADDLVVAQATVTLQRY